MEENIVEKPVLVIMAAGMGSRYGGLKQIDKIDSNGHIIMDYSIFDAHRAGFEKVVFIIKKENLEIFKEVVGDAVSAKMEVAFVFQDVSNLPEGFYVPEGRVKPWGTAHAVLSCIDEVKGPFAVINADDYYGPEAFKLIYDYLGSGEDGEKYRYVMVGYELGKTVTENGSVARGICKVDSNHNLVSVVERTRIEKKEEGIAYTEDDGESWQPLARDTIVSMNMWGFTRSILEEINERFPAFLEKGLKENPEKCEFYLPSVVSRLLEEEKAEVKVLTTTGQWYGVTYKEDKEVVVKALEKLREQEVYPEHMWK